MQTARARNTDVMSIEVNRISAFIKRLSIIAIVFVSFWAGASAYFAQAFTKGALEKIEVSEIDVSLATVTVAINWQALIVFINSGSSFL